jgi:MFS family permease
VGPAFTHLTVLFTSEGFDAMAVAGLMSYAGLCVFVSKIICGQLNDRLGGLLSNYIILGVYLVGLLLCCLAGSGSLPLAYLAITAFAFGISVTGPSPSVWARDLAAAADYAKTVRAITTAYTFGMLVFGPIPGIVADRFGSYVPAYALFALFQLALTVLIQGLYHRLGAGRRPRRT